LIFADVGTAVNKSLTNSKLEISFGTSFDLHELSIYFLSYSRRGIEIGSTSEKRKKSTMSAEEKRILSISSCFFNSFLNPKNMTAAPRARESRSQTRRRKFIYIIYSWVNDFP